MNVGGKVKRFFTSLLFSTAFIASSCLAQAPINVSNLFSDEDQLSVENLFKRFQNIYPQPTTRNDLKVINSIRKQISEMELYEQLAAIEPYNWHHFDTADLTESSYVAEFNLGYSKAFEKAKNAHYNIGIAIIRPAETSLAMNSFSLIANDDVTERSSFISFSVHSRF